MITPENNPFWRTAALDPNEKTLLQVVLHAHYRSAFRDNLSSSAVKMATLGSGDYTKAIAAALSTLGGAHAPLVQTYQFLTSSDVASATRNGLAAKRRIPGWGNSFHKGEPDPVWTQVEVCLRLHWPDLAKKLDDVTGVLHAAGKNLFPNPSAFTVLAAIALGIPPHLAPYLFVMGRLQGWSELFAFPQN